MTVKTSATTETNSKPLTFVVEAIDAVNTGTLVVPSEQEEVFRVLDLVGEEEADGLQRLLPAVHVVPQEKVVGLWREATVLKQPQEVRVLAVDVPCKQGKKLTPVPFSVWPT